MSRDMKFCPQCGQGLVLSQLEERERWMCGQACGFVHWNNPVPVVAGLVKWGDRYVLARNAAWPATWFSLISGFLEACETPEEAMARETAEELGLTVERVHFMAHYPFKPMNQLMICYVVEASGQLQPNAELAEVKCVSEAELQVYDFGELRLPAAVVKQWLGRQSVGLGVS